LASFAIPDRRFRPISRRKFRLRRHFLLNEGDSFAYSSDEPHRYPNPGPGQTIVFWAITPPTY